MQNIPGRVVAKLDQLSAIHPVCINHYVDLHLHTSNPRALMALAFHNYAGAEYYMLCGADYLVYILGIVRYILKDNYLTLIL